MAGRDHSKLTAKQRRFVEAYDGNATAAARAAGYSGNDVTLAAIGSENLRRPAIAKAIAAREQRKLDRRIATREERQQFWTATMENQNAKLADRLRAAELLGKSEGDFLDRVLVTGKMTLEQLVEAAVAPGAEPLPDAPAPPSTPPLMPLPPPVPE